MSKISLVSSKLMMLKNSLSLAPQEEPSMGHHGRLCIVLPTNLSITTPKC